MAVLRRVIGLVACVLISTGCSPEAGPRASEESDVSSVTPDQTSSFEGALLDITADAHGRPLAFDVETQAGVERVFVQQGWDYGFPLAHLWDHLESKDPIAVVVIVKPRGPVAVVIRDAD